MGKTLMAAAAALAAGTILAGAASAATVEYYLGGDGDDGFTGVNVVTPTVTGGPYTAGTSITLGDTWQGTVDGITLTVTPNAYTQGAPGTVGTFSIGRDSLDGRFLDGSPTDPNARLTQQVGGLGIMNNSILFTDDDPYMVDGSSGGSYGNGWYDFLRIEVSEPVTIDFAEFGAFGPLDAFRIMFDADGNGVLGTAGDFLTDALTASSGIFTGFPSDPLTLFGLAAVNPDSSWHLTRLGFSYPDPVDPVDPTPVPSPVPLPAAGFLLALGLGTLAIGRRKA
ncbi:hypothetical protein HKCCE2091_19655 [Rhodobacterales bacterium HKCCE2091]|nr:hypothetical protein [Rhodobacterales bacterium HKCCE2091]